MSLAVFPAIPGHQRAEIAPGYRLSQALVMVTWDDDFDKRRDREARRGIQVDLGPAACDEKRHRGDGVRADARLASRVSA